MKAVVYREYAPDDDYAKILKVEDIDSPKPKPDEIGRASCRERV